MTKDSRIFALIVAAGVGSRAGGEVPKQYAKLGGKALLRYSVEALAAHPDIVGVMVVIHPSHADYYDEAVGLGHLSLRERSDLPKRFLGRLAANPGEGASEQVDSRPHPDFLSAASQTLGNPTSPAGRGAPAPPLSQKLLPPVVGGVQRADSVRAGLAALAAHRPDYVLIHDAARPFLSHAMIDALIEKLTPEQAVVPALAVPDTVRRLENGAWEDVNREGLMRIQTPQGFAFGKLLELMNAREAGSVYTSRSEPLPPEGGVGGGLSVGTMVPQIQPPPLPSPSGGGLSALRAPTDDAAIWLAAGRKLAYVPGDERLRKVTTAEDLAWAQKQIAFTRRVAVGSGYDVHALIPGEGVIRLGGIDIAHTHKLDGHSDADVVLHAVVDALLGSIAAGDIGSFFPPSDARWKGANSAIFIEEARAQVAARGGEIQHLDVTIIGEQPKISPHREAMRAAIAAMLKLPLSHVSVKATTTEKLGFAGREEGIACQAVATVLLATEIV